ncbi:exocyst complex [Plasmopara halstedii]|uniref:Exocyst complex n=1 Tax=Plasmopara halstedii TaxID=4781 RepID=A0A0P1AIV5_PLAHL|nr:exocyst complex [Plasmopara halstedii]CEG40445.1 exocyst complex [Plasmopara halstedii]|eukprot:XP_024576814.1 exocyst complex [Plasmopara halstedii]
MTMLTEKYTAGRSPASSTVRTPELSAELEKLFLAIDDSSSAHAGNYDVETMVDELLTSKWEPIDPAFDSKGSLESFTQKTHGLHSLQSVLSDSIDRLVQHRKEVSDRIVELEHGCRRVSSTFQNGLEKPDSILSTICVQLEDLEDRFTKVSSTAVTIGDKLSTLDNERLTALETDELMDALLALNDPSTKSTKSSNRLVNTLHDPNQLHEASRIMKKVAELSSELSSPIIAYAISEIGRLCQVIENHLLTEFSNEQEKGNFAGMRKCAESLIEYNDKEKVADRYTNSSCVTNKCSAAGEPNVSSFDLIEEFDALCTKVHAICAEQFPVIDKVFPPVARNGVRELLLERLFNDPAYGVLSLMDQLLSTRRHTDPISSIPADAESASSATYSASLSLKRDYVKQLCAAFTTTCTMVADIDAIGLNEEADSHKQEILPEEDAKRNGKCLHKYSAATEHERIRSFLNLQLHSLFGNHRDRYVQAELDLLHYQFKAILSTVQFPQSLLPLKIKGGGNKAKNAILTSTATTTTPSSPASTLSNKMVSSAAISSTSSPNIEKNVGMFQSESTLVFFESVRELAENTFILSRYKDMMDEAIKRCESVLEGSELRGELLTKIFTSFVASFGEEYLAKVLLLTKETLQEQRIALDSPLHYIFLTEAILKRIDFFNGQFEYFNALLQDLPTQLTICQECHHKCLNNLESLLTTGLEKVLTVIEKLINQILTENQAKDDFLEGQTSMLLSSSIACQKCTEFLRPLVAEIYRVLVGDNCNRYLVALARSFKGLYLQHLKKFRFDPDGACMLLRDVSEYRDAFRSPSLPAAVDDIFDLLHEVANVFALPVENSSVGGITR